MEDNKFRWNEDSTQSNINVYRSKHYVQQCLVLSEYVVSKGEVYLNYSTKANEFLGWMHVSGRGNVGGPNTL